MIKQQIHQNETKPQVGSSFLWDYSSTTHSSEATIQTRIIKRLKIQDIFHMLLLEQNITKKWRIVEITSKLKFKSDAYGKKYEDHAIRDSAVYEKKLRSENLPNLYNLVL